MTDHSAGRGVPRDKRCATHLRPVTCEQLGTRSRVVLLVGDVLGPGGLVSLLTVPDAAEALAISRSKLYELLASGAIASIRIDGSRRIPLTALEEYVSSLLAERTAA